MSTRCQVQVIQEGLKGWEDKVTLYHHTDGYMDHMIPTIRKAFEYDTIDFRKGRAGKVASFLCWAEPGVFEPEDGHDLHGDISYYYRLYCVNHKEGSIDDMPTWEIEVFISPGVDIEDLDNPPEFYKNATVENMVCILERTELSQITPEVIEKAENREGE